MKRKIVALFLSSVTAMTCMLSACAAGSITVTVNSVVQLGDNIVVGSNAVTESELMKKYDESKEQLASNSTDIETNRNRLFDDLVPPVISDDDLAGRTKRKTLTYDEFMELLGQIDDLPDKSQLIEQYKESLKKKQAEQRKGNQITAKDLKDFYDKIRKGINPFTGEPFGASDNFVDDNTAARNAALDNIGMLGGSSGAESGDSGSDNVGSAAQSIDDMASFIKKQYDDILKNRNYSLIKHEKLDESEYKDDELVYENKNGDITDIHYRCSKCGELYGFDKLCSCARPKYLDGETYQYYSDNKSWLSYGWDFGSFNGDGESRNSALFKSSLECGLCGKKLTLDSLKLDGDDAQKFYVGTNGIYKCHECQEKYGGGKDMLNYYEGHPEELFPEGWPKFADPRFVATEMGKFRKALGEALGPVINTFSSAYVSNFLSFLSAERALAEEAGKDTSGFDALINEMEGFDPGASGETESVEEYEKKWDTLFEPHFDEFISPCTPILPDDSVSTDDGMFDYFLSMVPEEKREEFEKLRDTFKNGSDKDIQDAFLGTYKSEEDMVFAMNFILAYESGGAEAAFDYFMTNVPEEKRDKFKNFKDKFKTGDSEAAFSEFLDLVAGEEEWVEMGHLFDIYKDKGPDAAFGNFLSMVPEENRAQFKQAYDDFKASQAKNTSNGTQAAQKQENDKIIEQYAKKYYPDINKPMDDWTAEDYQKLYEKMLEDFNNSVPPARDLEGEKIKDTEQMKDDLNKMFGEWQADREQWTKKQWEMYEEFRKKYENDDTYKEMIGEGIFDPDKSPDEIAKAMDDYIAGFTSVSDNVTVITTVDYTDIVDAGQGGSYDVKGNTRAVVTDESGNIVAEREAVAGMPMTWVAYNVGHYTVTRSVDIYHIEWNFKKCTAVMKAVVVLPDGTTADVISGREVTRIIENRDGFKQTNCRTITADSFLINVVEDNSNIDKADFYDTERVR